MLLLLLDNSLLNCSSVRWPWLFEIKFHNILDPLLLIVSWSLLSKDRRKWYSTLLTVKK